MPKQTFFNLTEEKRGRIIGCAVDEFAEHGYDRASISRIVAAAGIAKGSFYQYFEDKDDLYFYVIESELVEYKLRLIEDEKKKLSGMGAVQLLCGMCKYLMSQFRQNPRFMKIAIDLWRNRDGLGFKMLYAKYGGVQEDFYMSLFQPEVVSGELNPVVDLEVLAAMIGGVGQLMIAKVTADGYDSFTDEYLDDLFGKAEYILTNGIYGNADKKKTANAS